MPVDYFKEPVPGPAEGRDPAGSQEISPALDTTGLSEN